MFRSIELEQLVIAWFAAASRGDVSEVDRHVSLGDGTRLIGSDPQEWFRGGEAVVRFLEGEVKGAGGSVQFTPSDIEAFSEGTVGWATAFLVIQMPDKRQVCPRWSAVFHKEDEIWKIVQLHASIPVGNDQIGWTYPA